MGMTGGQTMPARHTASGDDRGDPESGKQFYQSGKANISGYAIGVHGYDGKSESGRRKQYAFF